jgi:hypothetical protein
MPAAQKIQANSTVSLKSQLKGQSDQQNSRV